MEQFELLIAALGVIQPPIIEIFKQTIISKIQNDELRKSVTTLLSISVGIGIAYILNIVGNFEASIINIILLGGGVNFAVGQTARRAYKAVKK